MSRKQIFGLMGSAVLFIGVFAPILSVPVVGAINYFNTGTGDGVIVMLFALLSFVLVVCGKYPWLWLTGCATAGTLVASFINFQSHLSDAQSKVESDLAGNMFKGVAEFAVQSVQIQWGWPLLMIGSVMLIASAALKEAAAGPSNGEGTITSPAPHRLLVLVSVVLGLLIASASTIRPPLQLFLQWVAPGRAATTRDAATPSPAPKAEEEKVPLYEITKDDITSHPGWTTRNITVLGVKLGDRTRDVEKNLGAVENTRSLPEDYLTLYQGNGIFVYTFKLTGKARKIEVNQAFAKKLADANLRRLLRMGDVNTMREVLGMEEGGAIQNFEDSSIEYPYDSRGFRFVRFLVGGRTLNAIRFVELRRAQ